MATTQDQVSVVFTPSGRQGLVSRGISVLDAARGLGVDLDSVCGGRGICGRCQVTLSEGSFSKFGIEASLGNVSLRGEIENRYDRVKGLRSGCRLGCSAKLLGDMVIDVPEESQLHRQIVRKDAGLIGCEIVPNTRPLYVEVEKPDMHKPSGDATRLKQALGEQWGIQNVQIDRHILPDLQVKLRNADWCVSVALQGDNRVVAVYEGLVDTLYGIAVDIGTTTLSGHLCSLKDGGVIASEGLMNPQIRYGEDLMSRVSYGMLNKGGVEQMVTAIRTALQELLEGLVDKASISSDQLVELVVVGNPIMHHLLLGIDPVELGGAPFALCESEEVYFLGRDIGFSGSYQFLHGYVLPCIAGHVGADAAGVLLTSRIFEKDEQTLVIDVGTNAELLLGNREKIFACSSPTGPALEGAQIRHGQRASVGAIERVRIDKDSKKAKFLVIGSEKWSNEEGFAEDLGEVGVTGICGSGIIEAIGEMYLAGIIDTHGSIDSSVDGVELDGRSYKYCLYEGGGSGGAIHITQNDVRAIQLAKGAVYAGAKLLMEHAGLKKVDDILLAGAFGSHIDEKYAVLLGMLPDLELERVNAIGNAAGTGACIALLNKDFRAAIEQQVRRVEKIETALEPRFQEFFVDAMAIPNAKDPFDALWQVLEKPLEKTKQVSSARGSLRRKRR